MPKKFLNKTNEQRHLLGKVWFSLTTAVKAKTHGSYRSSVPAQASEAGGCIWSCRGLPRLRRSPRRDAAPGAGGPEKPKAGRRLRRDPPHPLAPVLSPRLFPPLPPGASQKPQCWRDGNFTAGLTGARGPGRLAPESRGAPARHLRAPRRSAEA